MIEDEIEFLVNNLEYLVEPDQTIKSYYQNRNALYILIAFNFLLEILIAIYIVKNEDFILKQLYEVYRYWHIKDF